MSLIPLYSLDDTRALAEQLARGARVGDVFTLAGDLGAGKTAFARFFIQALCGADVEVTSPTFNLLQTYPVRLASGKTDEIWHYDLYRVEHESALIELGLDEALQHITLIEWPEKLGTMQLPIAAALTFRIVSDTAREVVISSSRLGID